MRARCERVCFNCFLKKNHTFLNISFVCPQSCRALSITLYLSLTYLKVFILISSVSNPYPVSWELTVIFSKNNYIAPYLLKLLLASYKNIVIKVKRNFINKILRGQFDEILNGKLYKSPFFLFFLSLEINFYCLINFNQKTDRGGQITH